MKVRTGFVSNSSSSSFLVFIHAAFVPKSVDDVLKDMLGVTPDMVCPDQYLHRYHYTYREVAETLFGDLQTGDITDNKKAQQAFFHDLPQMTDIVQHTYHVATLPDEEIEKLEKRLSTINRIYRRKVLTTLLNRVADGDLRVYQLNYGDECGEFGSVMEHGDHWDRVGWAVIRFSHH
jgi:hypothetical protein